MIEWKVTHNNFFWVSIAAGMLKFHPHIVWRFYYRHKVFFFFFMWALAREAWTTQRRLHACYFVNMRRAGRCSEILWVKVVRILHGGNSLINAHHLETLIRSIQSFPYTPHLSLWISIGLCSSAHETRTALHCSSHHYFNFKCGFHDK